MQHLLFVILAPLASLVILLTLVYTWQRRNTNGAFPLMVYLLVVAGWLFANIIEVVAPVESATLFWAKFGYLFISIIPASWLAFALTYAGRRAWLVPSRFWVFFVIPLVTLLLALTTEMHGLIWSGYRFEQVSGLLVMVVDHGPWFWVFGLYMYSCLLAGAALIGHAYFGSHKIFRQQSLWTVTGALIPLAANAIYAFKVFPGLRQDYSSIAFAMAGLIFSVGIFKFRLLNLAPVARAALVETMPDGLLVLDPEMRVVDLNPAARKILGLDESDDLVGRPLHELWSRSARWEVDSGGWPDLLRVEEPGFHRVYSLRASGLGIRQTGQRGWLVVLNDVTQRVDAEEALAEANRSLAEANTALRSLNEELEGRIAARTIALTQRAQELEAVARVSSVLRKASGLEELLNILVKETVAVLEASAGAVFLLEEEDLVLSAMKSLSAHPGTRLEPCADPLWRVVDSGVALHLSIAAMVQQPASEFFLSLTDSYQEISIAPVHAANRILGLLLLVYDRRLEASMEEYARLLTAIAEMAGNALQRVRTVENLEALVQGRTRDLSALYEVTTASNLALELPELLERVLATVIQVLSSRAAVLHLVEENSSAFSASLPRPLRRNTRVSWPASGLHSLPVENEDLNFNSSGTRGDPGAIFAEYPLFLAAHVGLDTGSLSLLPSTHDTGSPWVQVLEQRGVVVLPALAVPVRTGDSYLSACVSVPVRAKGRILGVLSVLVESIGRFSAEDIALLVAISDHVGGAVERARLRLRAEEAAVIEERQRLARDLHDSVTQSLYSLVLFAEAGNDALKAGNHERAVSHLDRLRDTAQQALKEMRLLIYELRPMALQSEGLVGALRNRMEAVERRAGIDARLVVENLAPLPDRVEAGLYGIAQEALNNVIKHAHATHLTLRLNADPHSIEMEISDNGQGMAETMAVPEGGIGLSSMRERARALGGELSITSTPGEGTSVLVKIYQEPK